MTRFLRWLAVAVGLAIFAIAVIVAVAWRRSAPEPLATGTESATRLASGPHAVATAEYDWVDRSRPTPPNGDFSGTPDRTLSTTLWYPEGAPSAHPLVVFSHGLMSRRGGGTHMAEHLASYGYVVVAGDHPLSNGAAPGGATYEDLPSQPGDQSFLIDRVLTLGPDAPFEGAIDTDRIGVFGISLGGITSTLTAFHPNWRDPRIAAAISIAGPADVLGPGFFDHAPVPFLMIASTHDAIVPYESNAKKIPDRAATGALLALRGGSHSGYTHVTAGLIRLLGNPDSLGCAAILRGSEEAPTESVFWGLLGDEEQGLVRPADFQPLCSVTWDEAMRAGRQQQIATVAVRAFFESVFAPTEAERAEHARFLSATLPREVEEVSFEASRRPPRSVEPALDSESGHC